MCLLLGALAVDADVFREGIAPKILTSLNCSGNETNLLECDRVLFSGINCPTSGVICQGIKVQSVAMLYFIINFYI